MDWLPSGRIWCLSKSLYGPWTSPATWNDNWSIVLWIICTSLMVCAFICRSEISIRLRCFNQHCTPYAKIDIYFSPPPLLPGRHATKTVVGWVLVSLVLSSGWAGWYLIVINLQWTIPSLLCAQLRARLYWIYDASINPPRCPIVYYNKLCM